MTSTPRQTLTVTVKVTVTVTLTLTLIVTVTVRTYHDVLLGRREDAVGVNGGLRILPAIGPWRLPRAASRCRGGGCGCGSRGI